MLNYKLSKLAERRSGTSTALPMIQGSPGVERQYLAELRKMLKTMAKAIAGDVLPVVERELAQKRAALTQDVNSNIFERIEQLGGILARMTTTSVMRILGLEAQRHTRNFMQTARRALGVDLSAVVREEDLADELETVATRNAGLIKGLSDTLVQRVRQTVTQSVLTGTPVRDLKRRIAADLGVADSRARLIARDQTAKLNSDLNRIRHQQAGIEKYTWRTAHDERVRPRHRKLDGIIYAYGEPTGAEQGLPPGQPIQCRCIAQAIVEFGEGAATTKAKPQAEETAPAPEPGKKKLAREEIFAKLDKNKAVKFGGLNPEKSKDHFVKFLDGRDPDEFFGRMGFHAESKTEVRATFAQVVLEGQASAGGKAVGPMERALYLNSEGLAERAESRYLKLKKTSTGAGKQILSGQVDLYREMGVKVVDVHANIDVGGYAWAKYGYVPSEASWESLKYELQVAVRALPSNERGLLHKLLMSEDPKSIWAVADLPNGIGKRLLLGSDWEGHLDLRDEESLKRFNAYVRK